MYHGENQKQLHARQQRYKKPVIAGLSYSDMCSNLYNIQSDCSEVIWYWDNDEDTVINALCGDEDDAYEFRMQFSDLEAQCEELLNQLNENWRYESLIRDYFDSFFVAMTVQHDENDILGWDTFEQDFYSLNSWESGQAVEESRKRLERLTKTELIDLVARCIRVYTSYYSLQYRYDSLKAAIDIVKDTNTHVLSTVKELDRIYDLWQKDGCYKYSKYAYDIDRIGAELPEEQWIA